MKPWCNPIWLQFSNTDIAIEKEQASDEGRDITSLLPLFRRLAKADMNTVETQEESNKLLDAVQELPARRGYKYHEPSDLAGIRAARPAGAGDRLPGKSLPRKILLDKALGGWQGRASGCLLGKPAEGRRKRQIEKYLKTQGRWPLSDYFSLRASPRLAKECGFNIGWKALFKEGITCMVEDDDTNYTVTGLAIVERYGAGFTPSNVGEFWLNNIPIFHVCTAERIAYKNLVAMAGPPQSALRRNPYREWIGAQIRADFFGYVNPGNPGRAADFAWRDASISHIKNGIYGEMWVAAMLAAAYLIDDPEQVIRAGLAQIPARSRFTEAIMRIIRLFRDGLSYEDVIKDICSRWKEDNAHHWCHAISNAEIVATALLWGRKNFEKTICMAVLPGFDTDCNGATAGSVLGVMLGARKLPGKWIKPMRDTLLTGVAGYNKVSLTGMADKTVKMMTSKAGS